MLYLAGSSDDILYTLALMSDKPPKQPRKLLDLVRDRLRAKHYSLRTGRTSVQWICWFILLHGKRHTRDMGPAEVEAFLSHLATERREAASTQPAWDVPMQEALRSPVHPMHPSDVC